MKNKLVDYMYRIVEAIENREWKFIIAHIVVILIPFVFLLVYVTKDKVVDIVVPKEVMTIGQLGEFYDQIENLYVYDEDTTYAVDGELYTLIGYEIVGDIIYSRTNQKSEPHIVKSIVKKMYTSLENSERDLEDLDTYEIVSVPTTIDIYLTPDLHTNRLFIGNNVVELED